MNDCDYYNFEVSPWKTPLVVITKTGRPIAIDWSIPKAAFQKTTEVEPEATEEIAENIVKLNTDESELDVKIKEEPDDPAYDYYDHSTKIKKEEHPSGESKSRKRKRSDDS